MYMRVSVEKSHNIFTFQQFKFTFFEFIHPFLCSLTHAMPEPLLQFTWYLWTVKNIFISTLVLLCMHSREE